MRESGYMCGWKRKEEEVEVEGCGFGFGFGCMHACGKPEIGLFESIFRGTNVSSKIQKI